MKHLTLLSLLSLLLVACALPIPSPPAAQPTPASLTLITHDSFDISAGVLAQFTADTGIAVQLLKGGDAGEMLNALILSKENPFGDVVYGIDNTFLSRALDAQLFAPYAAPALADIPDRLKLDPENRLLPVDFGYVTLNYDIAWFSERGIEPPADIAHLTEPLYKGLTVVQNPASSSPGLAFLLASVGRFGDGEFYSYKDFWQDLRANDTLVVDGWSDAYYGHFTVGSGGAGQRPIVVSYATSPAAEVFFNDLDAPPTASVNTPGNSFAQIEFAGILANSPHQQAAHRLIDFLLSPTFQNDIPLHMFVYPANTQADSGDLFRQWAAIPADPITLAPEAIAANRAAWIETWTDLMLR